MSGNPTNGARMSARLQREKNFRGSSQYMPIWYPEKM